jgi:hypothetical protein
MDFRMKYYILFLLSSFLLFSCSKEEESKEEESPRFSCEQPAYGLECKISKIVDTYTSQTLTRSYQYDNEGREIGHEYWHYENELTYRQLNYIYDDKNNLIEYVRIVGSSGDSIKVTQQYNSDGNILKRTENGFDSGDEYLTEWTYDLNGKLDHYLWTISSVPTIERVNYKHDEFGNVIYYEQWWLTGDPKKLNISFEYFEDLRLRYSIGGGTAEDDYESIFTYDSICREIGQKNFRDGVMEDEFFNYSYDEYGNVIRQERISSSSDYDGVITYEYQCF